MDGDMVTICIVQESPSLEALKAITGLDSTIKVGGDGKGTHFAMPKGISENERQAWENIIRGIMVVR